MRPSTADGISASTLMPGSAYSLLAQLRIGSLRVHRPYDLRRELAVRSLLPLDVDHVVRALLAVRLRVGGELRASEEGHDVDLVERRLHLGGVGRARVLERLLQDQTRRVSTGRVVRGRRV